MLQDMNPADIDGEGRETEKKYYDNTSRKLLITDKEIDFPEGKLIVSTTDLDGKITHVNRAFVFMSGFTEEELIGQPHYILRHPDMPSEAFKDLWETVSNGDKWHGYVKNLRKDGACYWVYATVIPNVRKGEVVGYTSVRRKPSRKKVEEAEQLYKTMS